MNSYKVFMNVPLSGDSLLLNSPGTKLFLSAVVMKKKSYPRHECNPQPVAILVDTYLFVFDVYGTVHHLYS